MQQRFTIDTSLVLIYLIWGALGFEILFSLYHLQWTTVLIALATFFLTVLPFVFQEKFSLQLPNSFIAAIIFFIGSTLFLGEVSGFYEKFWWWDVLLHGGSALGFGIIGFVTLLYLCQSSKLQASPFLITIFSFSFAVAIGALWEIFEFAMDQLFGLNMQKSGLRDTMSDLAVDTFGAFLASLSGYIYLRFGPKDILSKLIHQFCRENMQHFRKKLLLLRSMRRARKEADEQSERSS